MKYYVWIPEEHPDGCVLEEEALLVDAVDAFYAARLGADHWWYEWDGEDWMTDAPITVAVVNRVDLLVVNEFQITTEYKPFFAIKAIHHD